MRVYVQHLARGSSHMWRKSCKVQAGVVKRLYSLQRVVHAVVAQHHRSDGLCCLEECLQQQQQQHQHQDIYRVCIPRMHDAEQQQEPHLVALGSTRSHTCWHCPLLRPLLLRRVWHVSHGTLQSLAITLLKL